MDDHKGIGLKGGASSRRSPVLRMRFVVLACVGIMFVLGSAGEVEPTRSSMELTRWKEFSYAREVKQVGGRMGVLEAVSRTGFVVLGSGEFARLNGWVVHTTTPEGKQCYEGMIMYDFQDGSSILARVDATGEPHAKQIGSIAFISGTKRFKGISGRGTLSSWMPSQWDMYTEVDASYAVSESGS